MKIPKLTTTFALAGLLAFGLGARASMLDATISIHQALNSQTLTIDYSGVHAYLIELRIDGQSVASRNVSDQVDSGETNFTIDPANLLDGDNNVEIRIFDRAGRLLGTRRTVVTAGSELPAPFFMNVPKSGQSVQGPVEISVGFHETFNEEFVSFFIDNKLMSMSNTPPFTYLWDTTRSSNGWHTLESWLVTGSSETYKTKPIRVFVNNVGGNTPRENLEKVAAAPKVMKVQVKPIVLASEGNPIHASVIGSKGLKPLGSLGHPVAVKGTSALQPRLSSLSLIASQNKTKVALTGTQSGLKALTLLGPLTSGPQHLLPTGNRYALDFPQVHAPLLSPITAATSLLPIQAGTRLPNLGAFAIIMNGRYVDFDVQPRVDHGIPMAPIRYLLERDGGKVKWDNQAKVVTATADGSQIWLKIGDTTALLNKSDIPLELAPYIDGNRTIVPLSFIHDVLKVNVQYDKATGHVLITKESK